MKYFFPAMAACLLCAIGCKKGGFLPATDNGCVIRTSAQNIKGTDSLAAVSLLKANNISVKDLRFYRVVLNDTVTNVNSGVTSTYQHIFALQYFNGVPLFSSDMGFHFKEGVLLYSDGTRYN